MKKIILFLIIVLLTLNGFAQDSGAVNNPPPATATQSNAQYRDSLSAVIRALNDSLNSNNNINNYIDRSALAAAKKNPQKLYEHDINHINSQGNNGWLRFAVMLLLLGSVWYFGLKFCITSGMCRDASYDTSGNPIDVKDRPYSYSRMQLFWWTMIIASCYIYFFGLTGVLVPLNMTAVILLGYGAIVLAGGKLIDQRQIQQNACGTRAQDQKSATDSFLTDILSDENGLSIHRFQAVIFNIVFGVGFFSYFVSALYDLQYPFADFSQGQFALLGISSATYLGLKMTENNAPANNGNANNNNGNQNNNQNGNTNAPLNPQQPQQQPQPQQPPTTTQPQQPIPPAPAQSAPEADGDVQPITA